MTAPRYGEVFENGEPGSFVVQDGDDELYLVVVATPSNILEMGINKSIAIRTIGARRKTGSPIRLSLVARGYTEGWLQPSTEIEGRVAGTAYVSPNAYIGPNAQVLGNAVEDYAWSSVLSAEMRLCRDLPMLKKVRRLLIML